jgi:hypothetical protein
MNTIKVGDAIFKRTDKIREKPSHIKSAKQFLQKLKCIARLFAFRGLIIYKIIKTKFVFLELFMVPENLQ